LYRAFVPFSNFPSKNQKQNAVFICYKAKTLNRQSLDSWFLILGSKKYYYEK